VPYTVLLIDDHALFRSGVAQLIGTDPDLELVAQAGSGEEGLVLARNVNPDLILIDLNMKGMSGLDTLRALKAEKFRSCCVMLTVSDEEATVVEALKQGADGYLLKDLEPEDLCDRLKSAVRGNVVLADAVANVVARSMRLPVSESPPAPSSPAATEPHLPELTEREREIVGHIAAGLSNKQIARVLGISDGTVKVHIKNLLRKLGAHSRLEAALWAVERRPPKPAH
jgi:two-component system, NarL family, nitrate/nitrite response regulator NarL